MKNAMLLLVNTILGVLMLIMVMTMYGRINRSMELESNLSSVLEESVENILINRVYNIPDTKELLTDLTEALVYCTDAQSEIQIDIMQCDIEHGIVAANASMLYKHPNGKEGIVETERVVIVNATNKDKANIMHTVTFYVDEEIYKIYRIEENNLISAPANPEVPDKVFVGWVKEDGTAVDFSAPIIANEIYFADIR